MFVSFYLSIFAWLVIVYIKYIRFLLLNMLVLKSKQMITKLIPRKIPNSSKENKIWGQAI